MFTPNHAACRAVAEIASFYDVPLFTWVATDPDFNDKLTYSTLARSLGPFSKMGTFLAEILAQYNWRRVVVISSNYLLYWDASKAIRQVFSESNITISYETTYNRFPPEAYITQSLTKAKLEGRSMYVGNYW